MEHRKYYVTKWFLTNGIKEVPGIPHEDSDYISVRMPGRRFSNSLRLGTDVFEKKSEAESRGRVLLRNEIQKTKKYLSRLQDKLTAMESVGFSVDPQRLRSPGSPRQLSDFVTLKPETLKDEKKVRRGS